MYRYHVNISDDQGFSHADWRAVAQVLPKSRANLRNVLLFAIFGSPVTSTLQLLPPSSCALVRASCVSTRGKETRESSYVLECTSPLTTISTDPTYLQIVIPFIQAARVNELQTLLHRLRRDQLRQCDYRHRLLHPVRVLSLQKMFRAS
jgi:hypothetical protein